MFRGRRRERGHAVSTIDLVVAGSHGSAAPTSAVAVDGETGNTVPSALGGACGGASWWRSVGARVCQPRASSRDRQFRHTSGVPHMP